MFLLTIFTTIKLRAKSREELEKDQELTVDHVDWDASTILKILSGSFLGGLMSAVVGNGGESVYSVIISKYGVKTKSIGPTTRAIVLLSSLSSALLFAAEGYLLVELTAWLATFTLFSILICVNMVRGVIEDFKRRSLATFVLAVLIVATTLSAPTISFYNLWSNSMIESSLLKFSSYC